jgi:hypothetical protein
MNDFERSLKSLPYPKLLDDAEFAKALKREYAAVTAIDYALSLEKYFEANMSIDELKRFANRDDEAISKAYELDRQFLKLKPIPDAYKVKDIKQTSIYKALANIQRLLHSYENLAMQNVDNSSQKAAEYFVNIKDNLKILNNSAQLTLIDEIMAENSNATILVQKMLHPADNSFEYEKRWEQLRNALNTKLITYKDELLMAAAEDNSHLIVLSKENIDKLSEYFTAQFKGIGRKENLFVNNLIPCLSKPRNSGKDYSAIALVIYESHFFKHNKGDGKISFPKWIDAFYDIMGLTEAKYKKKSVVRSTAEGYKYSEFYFLN